jgi:hypothetical protein
LPPQYSWAKQINETRAFDPQTGIPGHTSSL